MSGVQTASRNAVSAMIAYVLHRVAIRYGRKLERRARFAMLTEET